MAADKPLISQNNVPRLLTAAIVVSVFTVAVNYLGARHTEQTTVELQVAEARLAKRLTDLEARLSHIEGRLAAAAPDAAGAALPVPSPP